MKMIKKHLQNIIEKYEIKIDRDVEIPNEKRHRIKAMQDLNSFITYKDGQFFEYETQKERKSQALKELIVKLIDHVSMQ